MMIDKQVMTANDFIRWLMENKVCVVPDTEGLQGVYIIWDGKIQALIENCGEYWEVKNGKEVTGERHKH